MRKISVLFFSLIALAANAQCSFDVVVTPASLQLCPNSSDTIWCSAADSYVWYKNNNPIVGANLQYLVVNQQADAGANFVVVATIAGCSEPGPSVHVSNAVTSNASISIAGGLSPSACTGDFRELILNDPYNVNIRWFRNGVQLSGQTNDTLLANQSGLYSATAFTDVCPLYSQTAAGIQIDYVTATTPVIAFNSSTLELSTSTQAAGYIWQINGDTIEGATGSVFLPQANGQITVTALFSEGCERTSIPYNYTSFVLECPHDPTVSPGDLVLCPGAEDTLFTQAADSYQWFRDGVLIEGAMDSFLVVNQFQDAGSNFSVEATLDGCPEMSPEVLVDGWVFLPITVSTEGNLNPLCAGDTLTLQVLSPFTENVQWMFNGNPVEGGTGITFEATETGTYSVNASIAICPDYNETSLNLEYIFAPRPQPVINYFSVSNTLSADVQAASYVWMLEGAVISGANTQIITP
ncbi:MAG: hypothetical protein KDC13_07720, partial [Bacteroidetes bacterium]|nr:hypothetical protein [Bacteroidota bacterium]